jgi:hypothetical protein
LQRYSFPYTPNGNRFATTIPISADIYVVFTGCEVRTEKLYFPEVSDGDRGRRPRDASEAEGKYFLVRTNLNGK